MTTESTSGSGLSPLKRAVLALEEARARIAQLERGAREPIAVIGIGCRFPGGANSPAALWKLLCDGVDAIGEIPSDRWDVDAYFDADVDAPGKMNTRFGGFVDGIDRFDPGFFGISPREAASMDPQQRLVLEVAWEALERAGIAPDRLAESRTGVFVGIVGTDYAQLMTEAGVVGSDTYFASGIGHSVASGRISYVLGLKGPSVSVDTACSSSLVATHLAVQSLRTGECDLALAGGTNAILTPDTMVALAKYRMLAPDGRCKTFDARADGFARGEGAGVVVLKRLRDAVAAGDPILAVIHGSAVNQDGPSSGLTAPNGPSQAAVIRAALDNAGIGPERVGYVEAHGTGTSLGDPIEMQALGDALGARGTAPALLVGSVKTNLGHLESAAGVAGLIKAVLCLHHGQIPPHLHFETPSPFIPWNELPVAVPTIATALPVEAPYCGVSSFGFSGTNAHLVLGPAPVPAERKPSSSVGSGLVLLSARSDSALAETARAWAAALDDSMDLADVSYTSAVTRASHPIRVAVIASDIQELRDRLLALAEGRDVAGGRVARVTRRDPAQVAFLFTGQGAQYAGMGQGLYQTEPVFRAALDRCAAIAAGRLDAPLLDVMFGNGQQLDQTGYTQPALFALEYAMAELWRTWGIHPSGVIGHSVGELAAACVAGVMSLEDAMTLVIERGRLMQALPAGGAMTSVAASEARVQEVLARVGGTAVVAAVNGDEQAVIAGPKADVDRVAVALAEASIRSQPLVVSHAFHSPLLDPMLDAFEAAAGKIRFSAPRLRLISNLTGTTADATLLSDPSYWRRHARDAVRFVDGIRALAATKPQVYLEVGPHPTLLGLTSGALGNEAGVMVGSLRRSRSDGEQVREALASLFLAGASVDWRAVHGAGRRVVPLPTTPFDRERCWFGMGSQTCAIRPAGHPLLGSRVPLATDAVVYEQQLGADQPGFVRDHRVHGRVILPATAYLEAIRAASSDAGIRAVSDIAIQQAMVFDDDTGTTRRVQLIRSGRDGTIRIASQSTDGTGETDWTEHLVASAGSTADGEWSGTDLRAREAACTNDVAPDSFYQRLDSAGLDFGPRFRVVRELRHGDREAVGVVVLDDGLSAEAGRYHMHPVLLDGCLQVIAAATPDTGTDVFLPIGIGRYHWADSVRGLRRCISCVRVEESGSPDTLRASVDVYDEHGAPAVRLTGVQLKRVTRAALARLGERQVASDLLLEPVWVEAGADRAAGRSMSGAELSALAAAELPRLAEGARLDRYDEFRVGFDALCLDYVVQAVHRLGWTPNPGDEVVETVLAERLGIIDRHRQLFGRLLGILAEGGYLARRADRWLVQRALTAGSPDRVAQNLAEQFPDGEPEVTLTRRAAEHLDAALRGQRDPLELLFPGGSLETAERVYRDAPPAKVFNGLAGALVGSLAGAQQGKPLRILEVGGGTGGTTAYALPALAGQKYEYTFSDVGPLFVAKARERFGSHAGTRFATLDLERDPGEQGFAPGSFDLIVAANVIHATSDIRRTLRYLRTLLAPGGRITMLEATTPQRWFDLTVGLTEGWWWFTDRELRSEYPTLPADRWVSLLQEFGFEDVAVLPGAGHTGTLGMHSLIVAGLPAQTGRWVVVAEGDDVGAAVKDVLVARGDEVECIDNADQIEQRLGSGNVRGLIYVPRLSGPGLRAGARAEAALDVATGGLAVVQAVLSRAPGTPIWLLTRGAVGVDGNELPVSAEQSTLWGLARSAMVEHPELQLTCVDLEPGGEGPPSLTGLLDIFDTGDEPQVALRGGRRYAARLSPWHPRTSTLPETYCLVRSAGSTLDDLHLAELERRPPGPGEVEIAVEATGLNFKDVLNALGMYPGDPGPLGGECAGTVVRTGAGVTDFQVGDAVMALASGSFSSHVTVASRFVARRPDGMPADEGAAFPIAFMTARFCLEHTAHLRAGERVLIHAATGGVGFAAVQLALGLGAEVFATAGSEAKRQLLRDLGVRHVFDSRSPAFADQVLAITEGKGVDVVLNSLAGEVLDASFRVIGRGGRFVEMGKRGIWTDAQVTSLGREVQYTVIDWGETAERDPALVAAMLETLTRDLVQGRVRSLPRHVFELEDASRAFRFMAQARHIGKVVVRHRAPESFPVRRDGTYLVTGGLSGLGLAVANRLSELGAGRLVLLSRRGVAPESEPLLAAIRGRGTEVVAESVDVSSEAALRTALDRARSTAAPLRGIVHSAGSLDDAVFSAQSRAHLEHVFGTKVRAVSVLDEATRSDALDWTVFFSSVAGIVGSPGQANHAAANVFMDRLAGERMAEGRPTVSIAWGAWAEIGAARDASVQRRAASRGLETLSPATGLALFERAVTARAPVLVAAKADWRTIASANRVAARLIGDLAQEAVRVDALSAASSPAATSLADQLAAAPAGRRKAIVAAAVRERALRSLGLDPSRPVDVETPLAELGLDSLLAVELRNALGSMSGVALPATLLFDHPTLAALTEYLDRLLNGASEAPAPEATPVKTDVVASIEDLSDDEVDRLLAARAKGGRK